LEETDINHEFGLCNGFCDMTPKAQSTKEKNKLDFFKIKELGLQRILLREGKQII
jgi:hypothetical protein